MDSNHIPGIAFDDLDASKNYEKWQRYGHSKLANILFTRVRATCRSPGSRTGCSPESGRDAGKG